MVRARIAVVAALGLAIYNPSGATAETCLQKFSCKLYGECRFPCLDAVLGHEAAPTHALANEKLQEGKAVSISPSTVPKLVHREHRKPQIHLVTANDISSLSQLAGKVVSFGPPGSTSQATGRRFFAQLGIEVNEAPLDLENALDGVTTGDVAAVLVLRPRDLAKARAVANSKRTETSGPKLQE